VQFCIAFDFYIDDPNYYIPMIERIELLKKAIPFNVLPDEVLQNVAEQLQEVTYTKEAVIYKHEVTRMKGVDIIAEGEYEMFFYDSMHNKRNSELISTGDTYGGISVLLNGRKSIKTVIAKKGTRVYFLKSKDFKDLCNAYENFFHYFTSQFSERMQDAEFAHFFKRPIAFDESFIGSEQLYSKTIENITYRDILSCTKDTPIYYAARMMADEKISCIFVRDENGKIIGYATDITLRDNVVAKHVNVDEPIVSVMDNPIVSVDKQAYVYEAILKMFRTKARYILIEDNDEFIGCISRNKLLSEQAESPLVFIQSVKLAVSLDELRTKWQKVPEIVSQLLGRGVNAEIVNQVITTVSDTIAVKVIEEVIEEMGAPPAKFVFMVLGSEGRKEQTLKTDQDNAIIYEDKANEQRELVREYFLKFATTVSDRLNYIGFVYCTGDFMAKNPKWTHSLSHWKRNYQSWMEEPLPESVIMFSTFFDCRHLYGDVSILDELKQFLDEELQKPLDKLFFYMAKNALQYEPPLTFFRNIRTFTKGNIEVFDIKKSMTPIVDLIRVYALKNRVFEVNTGERLKALRKKGIFNDTEFLELLQSYYFLMSVRLKKQAAQIMYDKTDADNYVNIGSLTKIEQGTIKEIFKTLQNFQSKIKIEFTNELFA
jgi:CBS domain-containing protein